MENSFANKVLIWFDQHGRKDLPWQQNSSAYSTWVSEIMLQQTQVATVIPYFQKFMVAFPDVITLANADQDHVLQHWAGLGYYSRARNLHAAAQQVRDEFEGIVPDSLEGLVGLSGIGRSTAGAILSLAYHQSQPILDGNVKRVLTRYHALSGWTGKAQVLKELWLLAEKHLPSKLPPKRNADYTQAMMDLGATLCTRSKPTCLICPLHENCKALKQGNPTDYPTPKPRKVVPDKYATMLLVMNDNNEVLLEKRPSPGIWGGLWSLPQFEDLQAAEIWYEKAYSDPFHTLEELDAFTHTFSHFRLHVQPIAVKHSTRTKGVMEANDILWYNSATHFSGGLPAPIKKLFKRIQL
ncbi:MAG: A/G-specific adenine glycosylase [Thiotrichaceae bacterium]